MKKIVLFFILLMTTGCSTYIDVDNSNTSITNEMSTEYEISTENTPVDRVQEVIDKMSIEEKVGQLFMVMPEAFDSSGSDTTVISSEISEKLRKYNVGGIILFAKNIIDSKQTSELISGLQKASERPLFIAVDEEGGRVARVGNNTIMNVEKIEPMSQVVDKDRAFEIGNIIGKYLSELGFNLDFAPVADVLINSDNTEIGDRSFGSDPQVCGDMVSQVVKGLQQNNVSASLKHFPGHGGFESNSHQGLSESNRTLEEMRSNEFIPFKMGIDAGSDFVMIAHLSVPNITGDSVPATLSKYIVSDLLKNDLGFNGVVVSDALNMGAIVEYYGADTAAIMALNAGIDMLLMPENLDSAYNAILNAVKNGEVSEERINDACYRIISIKMKKNIM